MWDVANPHNFLRDGDRKGIPSGVSLRSQDERRIVMNIRFPAMVTLLAAAAGPSLAESPATDVPTVAVPYGDLDLSREGGRAALDGRIRAAVRTVCRPIGLGPLESIARHRCERRVLAAAREDAALAALAQSRVQLARRQGGQ